MIENWVQPLDVEHIMGRYRLEDYQLGNHLDIYESRFPNLHPAQLVLIGLDEIQSNIIRKELYRCSYSFGDMRIADIGNIKNSDNNFIIPLLSELIQLGILPIIIGENTHQFRAQLVAHRESKRDLGFSLVSKNLKVLHTVLSEFSDLSSEVYVKYFYAIAIQAHYTNPNLLLELEKNDYEILRLGELHHSIMEASAFLRNSEVLCFDMTSVRSSEAPAQINPTAGGLSLEQACQLSRYAGISERISSFGIYGFNLSLDRDHITASTIAQMIWYFIDGFANREEHIEYVDSHFIRFTVDYQINGHDVEFYKSKISGKWWVDLAFMNKNPDKILTACSYDDYLSLCNNELSDRMLRLIKRSAV